MMTSQDAARFLLVFGLTLAIALLAIAIGARILIVPAHGAEDAGVSAAPPPLPSPASGGGKRAQRAGGGNSTSLDHVVAPLAQKARAIVNTCGSKVVSSVRVGAKVFGGNASNHASGRAVDLQGNPRCIYAQLKGWPGGVSTDYARAPNGPHVHVSYNPGGMEWGLRFKHRAAKRRR